MQPADPERALSLAYAPRAARPGLSALWRLDEQLGAIVARTENPGVGQLRLTWWYDALDALGSTGAVDPVLIALKESRVDGKALLPLIDGWEALLEPLPLSEELLLAFADSRGGTLFGEAARLLDASTETARAAGRVWALVDLAFRISDRATAERALDLVPSIEIRPLPKPLRLLAILAQRDALHGVGRGRRQGSPTRVARALWAGLTGR